MGHWTWRLQPENYSKGWQRDKKGWHSLEISRSWEGGEWQQKCYFVEAWIVCLRHNYEFSRSRASLKDQRQY